MKAMGSRAKVGAKGSRAGSLLSALEEHNKHLARELHDVVIQKLAALGMEIEELQRKPARSADELRRRVRRLSDRVAALANTTHEISRQLHPAILEDLGLVEALRGECLLASELYGNPITFAAVKVPLQLPPDAALCLYRVAQEALRNAGRHAPGAAVSVNLAAARGALTLSVEDAGPGFRDEGRRRGLGLISMAERSRLVNGKLRVRSRAGKGTVVTVRVPVKRDAPRFQR